LTKKTSEIAWIASTEVKKRIPVMAEYLNGDARKFLGLNENVVDEVSKENQTITMYIILLAIKNKVPAQEGETPKPLREDVLTMLIEDGVKNFSEYKDLGMENKAKFKMQTRISLDAALNKAAEAATVLLREQCGPVLLQQIETCAREIGKRPGEKGREQGSRPFPWYTLLGYAENYKNHYDAMVANAIKQMYETPDGLESPSVVESNASKLHDLTGREVNISDLQARWKESALWDKYNGTNNLDGIKDKDKLLEELDRLWTSDQKEGAHLSAKRATVKGPDYAEKKPQGSTSPTNSRKGKTVRVNSEQLAWAMEMAIAKRMNREAPKKPVESEEDYPTVPCNHVASVLEKTMDKMGI